MVCSWHMEMVRPLGCVGGWGLQAGAAGVAQQVKGVAAPSHSRGASEGPSAVLWTPWHTRCLCMGNSRVPHVHSGHDCCIWKPPHYMGGGLFVTCSQGTQHCLTTCSQSAQTHLDQDIHVVGLTCPRVFGNWNSCFAISKGSWFAMAGTWAAVFWVCLLFGCGVFSGRDNVRKS